MTQKAFLFLFLLVLPFFMKAQTKPNKGTFKEERSLLYKNEGSVNIGLHTNGFILGYRRGFHVTGTSKKVFEADFLTMKHPRESKQSAGGNSESFVFGKASGLVVLRTGYGYQNAIFEKAEKGGVEIRYHYSGGISWGFTKPIYLVTEYQQEEKILTFSDTLSHFYPIGKASFFKGINEIKVYPGAYGKVSISFEYGKRDEDIKTIETGIAFDLYAKRIPMMVYGQNYNNFLTFYLIFSWGKKW